MNFRSRKSPGHWEEEKLVESTEYLGNPDCGWYHIHSFSLAEKPDLEELFWCICKEEALALLILDIGAYREGALPETALIWLRELLDFFIKQEKTLIVRAVYDREGKGMEREPNSIAVVEQHMKQLGAVLGEYEEHILVVQGLLVGSWGEMHGSKFLAKEKLCALMRTYREALGENICMAVRRPQQWRQMFAQNTPMNAVRTGLFDDGMFGSETNLGTYGTLMKEAAGWEREWCRIDELEFVGALGSHVPYGGEAVGAEALGDLQNAVSELGNTHVSYLNGIYDEQILSRWRKEIWQEDGVWNGVCGYDYIGCHLGYRLIVRSASEGKSGRWGKSTELTVVIENVGFAPLFAQTELYLIRESASGEHVESLLCEFGIWQARECQIIPIPLQKEQESQTFRLFLKLRRKRDKRVIRFANTGAGERLLLGSFVNG